MANTVNTMDEKMTQQGQAVKLGVLFRGDAPMVTFRQRFVHSRANLQFLDCGEYEDADKLVAGYTFFEPNARSWPPHNHADQKDNRQESLTRSS
jgi:hypothetical protein